MPDDVAQGGGGSALLLGFLSHVKDPVKETKKRKGATILFEVEVLELYCTIAHTPCACDTLCVAAPHHYDIQLSATEHLKLLGLCCMTLLEPGSVHKIGPSAAQPFDEQARLALRVCEGEPWGLRRDGSRSDSWSPAGERSVEEQVNALLQLAQRVSYDWAS